MRRHHGLGTPSGGRTGAMRTSEKQAHRTRQHRAASPCRGAYPCASRGGFSTIFSLGGSEVDSGWDSCSFRPTAAASSRTTCAATLSSWARAAFTKASLEALVSISSSSTTPSSRSAIFSSRLPARSANFSCFISVATSRVSLGGSPRRRLYSESYTLRKEHADSLDDLHLRLSRKSASTSRGGQAALLASRPQPSAPASKA